MKRSGKFIAISVGLLIAFALWTLVVSCVDMGPIGPQGSLVGLASLNRFAHELTGVHFALYHITDWLGLLPVFLCVGFGFLGFVQWVKRKRFFRVDGDILLLGAFYVVTAATYVLFESVVINCRPVLINGYLEASYPSSTTLLVMCVMPTAAMQMHNRITDRGWERVVRYMIILYTGFMVIARFLSGVHWISDIIGGMLLSGGLVTLYYGLSLIVKRRK